MLSRHTMTVMSKALRPVLLLPLLFIPGWLLTAQVVPTTPEVVVPTPQEGFGYPSDQFDHRAPSIAIGPDGGTVVVWTSLYRNGEAGQSRSDVVGRLLDGDLSPGAGFVADGGNLDTGAELPTVVAGPAEAFSVAYTWIAQFGSFTGHRSYGADGAPLAPPDRLAGPLRAVASPVVGAVSVARKDGVVALAWEQREISQDPLPGGAVVSSHLMLVEPDGTPITPALVLSSAQLDSFDGAAAIPGDALVDFSDAAGAFLVVWQPRTATQPVGLPLRGRLFSLDGAPVATSFELGAAPVPPRTLRVFPDGDFLIAGSIPRVDSFPQGAYRRFRIDGTPESEFRNVTRTLAAAPPGVTVDAFGNWAVLFDRPDDIFFLELYNFVDTPDGFPLSKVTSGRGAAAVLEDSGAITVAWAERPENGSNVPGGLRAQGFRKLRNDDVCRVAGNHLACRFSRRFALGFGGSLPGFGLATDRRLAGDVDGDDRDDQCIQRGNLLLCDTAADGVTAEARLRFGPRDGKLFLADLDGDGFDDPCLRLGNRFVCDTARNGGAGEVRIPFGTASDIAVTGDVNGDGADDPCLFRDGLFACDTAHDGVFAERFLDLREIYTTHIVPSGVPGTPYLADLDGDEQDDACIAGDRFLVCAILSPGGAVESEESFTFGSAEQGFVLGDMDRF